MRIIHVWEIKARMVAWFDWLELGCGDEAFVDVANMNFFSMMHGDGRAHLFCSILA